MKKQQEVPEVLNQITDVPYWSKPRGNKARTPKGREIKRAKSESHNQAEMNLSVHPMASHLK